VINHLQTEVEVNQDVDVIVVGGGAMGSAAAWQLAKRGVDVGLLEQYEPGHTKGASHGTSRIFRLSYADPVYIRLAQRALRQWRELEAETGTELLTITGGVDHGGHPDLGALADALGAAGVERTWLDPDEAAERWPGMRFDQRVLFHPDSGRLHADNAVAALQAAAVKHGAVVRHRATVESIDVAGDETVFVHTRDATYRARRVVVATNAWAPKLVGGQVPLPPLRITQEQPAHFATRSAATAWPSFVHQFSDGSAGAEAFHGTVYGLDSAGAGVKVGFHGGGQIVDPDHRDFLPDPGQLASLRDYVCQWLPGLDADDFVPISCTYTTTPDSNFVLDSHGPLVIATGFSGHGFKFTPAIGTVLADLAVGGVKPDGIFGLASHGG
jgi:sarcosine oxidase